MYIVLRSINYDMIYMIYSVLSKREFVSIEIFAANAMKDDADDKYDT